MWASRWLAAGVLALASSAPLGAAQRAAADDTGRVASFGTDGTAELSAGSGVFRDAVVTDDPQGRILVIAEQGSNFYPLAAGFIARLLPDGRPDPTFGTNGEVRIPFNKYGARLAGIEVLPDGRIVYGLGGITVGTAQVSILSADGGAEESIPLYVPPLVGVNDLERLPDGGVLIGAGGLQPLWILQPNGTLDPSFTPRLDHLAALGQSNFVVHSATRLVNGRYITAVHAATAASGSICELVGFERDGGLVPTVAQTYSSGQYDQCPHVLAEPTGAFLWAGQRYDGNGALVGPAPTNPDAVDGTGRLLELGDSALAAIHPDGSVDESFGASGTRPLAQPGDPSGVRVLRNGNILTVTRGPIAAPGAPYDPSYHHLLWLTMFSGNNGDGPQPPALAASKFVPVVPRRLLDTRIGLGTAAGAVPADHSIDLKAAGDGLPVPAGATAVVLNVTATDSAAAGFVSVYPTGQPRPSASSLNLEGAGQTRANLVTVPLGQAGSVSLYTQSGAQLVADIEGYYVATDSSADGRFVPLAPQRLIDTRPSHAGVLPGPQPMTVRVPIQAEGLAPANVAAVAVNVTVTNIVAAGGYATAWPTGLAQPFTSNVNFVQGDTRANLAIVPVGDDGSISIATSIGADVVVDIVGSFTNGSAPTSTAGLFVSTPPTRVMDTRISNPSAFAADSVRTLITTGNSPIPAALHVHAVLANVTLTQAAGPGYVTVWPGGTPQPNVSSINATRAGETIANAALMPLGPTDIQGIATISAYAQTATHLILDVNGYYL